MPKVYWALLLERAIGEVTVQSMLDVAAHCGRLGYHRLGIPYCRTDIARNTLIRGFQKVAQDPQDTLVMLDNDHVYPRDVVERLVAHNQPVVGALAFRRGEPYFPCAFVPDADGNLRVIGNYPQGLLEVAMTGTGAIAIQRQVFDQLDEAGFSWPYFRYTYKAGVQVLPSEDMYFGENCRSAGISHWLDTTLVIPHITVGYIDEESWTNWLADHPEMVPGDDIYIAQMLVPQAEVSE